MKSMQQRRAWLSRGWVLVLALLVAGCGSNQKLRDQYSELQLRQVVESADGLQLELRLSNFGEKPFDVDLLTFTLAIEGRPPISQSHPLQMTVSGWGTEPLTFKAPGARLGDAGADAQLRYQLTGVINRKGFRGPIEVRHDGVLSPIPGVSGAWR